MVKRENELHRFDTENGFQSFIFIKHKSPENLWNDSITFLLYTNFPETIRLHRENFSPPQNSEQMLKISELIANMVVLKLIIVKGR